MGYFGSLPLKITHLNLSTPGDDVVQEWRAPFLHHMSILSYRRRDRLTIAKQCAHHIGGAPFRIHPQHRFRATWAD